MNELDILIGVGMTGLLILAIGLAVFNVCEMHSNENLVETRIVDVSESDILWDEQDFYILDPDGVRIPLGIDDNEILDLTKHSKILVKFKRYPAYGLYGGSSWFVDGVVKTPNP